MEQFPTLPFLCSVLDLGSREKLPSMDTKHCIIHTCILVEVLQDRNSKKGRKVDGVFLEGN